MMCIAEYMKVIQRTIHGATSYNIIIFVKGLKPLQNRKTKSRVQLIRNISTNLISDLMFL